MSERVIVRVWEFESWRGTFSKNLTARTSSGDKRIVLGWDLMGSGWMFGDVRELFIGALTYTPPEEVQPCVRVK